VAVVVAGVLIQQVPKMAFTEDQHPVGEFGSGGQHEPLGIGVRPGTPGRDLDGLDAGAGEDRVEGGGELAGPVPDKVPEVGCLLAEVQQQVPGLLGGPAGSVAFGGAWAVTVTLGRGG
jgi:hypothetical protein